jgi:phosphoribosylamine---glycine ligase
MTPAVTERAMDEIVRPTIAEMARRGMPFRGCSMRADDRDGAPRLVEYNVRFGDPECQVLMMRLGATGARPDARLRRGPAGQARSTGPTTMR